MSHENQAPDGYRLVSRRQGKVKDAERLVLSVERCAHDESFSRRQARRAAVSRKLGSLARERFPKGRKRRRDYERALRADLHGELRRLRAEAR